MRDAAAQPFDPGYVAAGLSHLFSDSVRKDEHAMEAIGSLVGYLFRAAGYEAK